MSTQIKICNCNQTMPLDAGAAAALAQACGTGPVQVSEMLCRREVGAYLAALDAGDALIVGCTQERALFSELAQNTATPLKFVNLRENAGWGRQGRQALPKMAALLAAAALPDPEPVASISYRSQGRLLIVGPASAALPWARRLAAQMEVSVLLSEGAAGGESLGERNFPVWSGQDIQLSGYLGAFHLTWRQANPIDLEACVRCNACIAACPEQAIDFSYQIDLDKCRNHRACVKACGAIAAIDFARMDSARSCAADLVLDLSRQPLLRMTEPPPGYCAPDRDWAAQCDAVLKLTQLVGEFEKPKFFIYQEKLCAHGRSGKQGCHACLDVCSTAAIASAGDKVQVDSHLCAGCGACGTVCPSGALSHAYMRPADTGLQIKTMLAAYARAGGAAAGLLLHSREAGAALLLQVGQNASRGGAGLPARMLPLALHHTASTGIELWLSAICYGATNIVIVLTEEEAPEYRAALQQQIVIAQHILSALGYAGQHFCLLPCDSAQQLETALHALLPAQVPAQAAGFNVASDKRGTLDFALSHLRQHAALQPEQIALPAGAPFGSITVRQDACTLCMACVGACPAGALLDKDSAPQLRFIESNCLQCGLCAETCPEQAIALQPRLLLSDLAKQRRILHQAEPYHCLRCNKAFATAQMIENMLEKLAAHGAFAGHSERLRMCADCRVLDMMESGDL